MSRLKATLTGAFALLIAPNMVALPHTLAALAGLRGGGGGLHSSSGE